MHTRMQVISKRQAAHKVLDMQPQKAVIVREGVYCHTYEHRDRPARLISNSTGKRVA